MRPQQKSSNRARSKGGRKGSGPSLNRVYESSGPEGKVRGTPQQIVEKYQALARDKATAGDRVLSESFQQHAEHYLRIILSAQQQQQQQNRREDDSDETTPDQGSADARTAETAPDGLAVIDGQSGSDLVATPESLSHGDGASKDAGGGDDDSSRRRRRRPRRDASGESGGQRRSRASDDQGDGAQSEKASGAKEGVEGAAASDSAPADAPAPEVTAATEATAPQEVRSEEVRAEDTRSEGAGSEEGRSNGSAGAEGDDLWQSTPLGTAAE